MNIIWEISESDIKKVTDFVAGNKNSFVEKRINRNVNRNDIQINRDTILKTMLMCLLTSQQESITDNNIEVFFRKKPFLLTYEFLSKATVVEVVLRSVLKENGLTKYFDKIQDKLFYHFVSDGIQLLCEKANIYPCVLDAAIISANGDMK